MAKSKTIRLLKLIKQHYAKLPSTVPQEYDLLEKGQFVGSKINEVTQIAYILKKRLQPQARILDLGSGDGRVVFTLATIWEKAEIVGIEYHKSLYQYSLKLREKLGFSPQRIKFFQKDYFQEDFRCYDLIFYYYWGTWEEEKLVQKLTSEPLSQTILVLYGHGMNKEILKRNFSRAYRFIDIPQIKSFAYVLEKSPFID